MPTSRKAPSTSSRTLISGTVAGTSRAADSLSRPPNLRVLILDKKLIFAEVVEELLESHGIEVVGIATDAEMTLSAAWLGIADLVLVCLWVGDILERRPEGRAAALRAPAEPGSTGQDDQPGVSGEQGMRSTEERAPQRQLESGRLYFGHEIDDLTARERQVLALLLEGASTKQIARRLALTGNTVRTHVQNLLDKLGVHSRLQAVAAAVHFETQPDTTDGPPAANSPRRP